MTCLLLGLRRGFVVSRDDGSDERNDLFVIWFRAWLDSDM